MTNIIEAGDLPSKMIEAVIAKLTVAQRKDLLLCEDDESGPEISTIDAALKEGPMK